MSEINITKETVYTVKINESLLTLSVKDILDLYQKLGIVISEDLTRPNPFLASGKDLQTHIGTGNPSNWGFGATATKTNEFVPRTEGSSFIGSSNGGNVATSHAGGASTLV